MGELQDILINVCHLKAWRAFIMSFVSEYVAKIQNPDARIEGSMAFSLSLLGKMKMCYCL